MSTRRKVCKVQRFKALAEGQFEALVAVFGVQDRQGDVVERGAFKTTLARWRGSGQRIPVIFSHASHDPNALIGYVIDGRETAEGLEIKGQLDIDEPYAATVWRKLKTGILSGFSYSYTIVREKLIDGVKHLFELDLLEVGPTAIPANPDARLIRVASLDRRRTRPPSRLSVAAQFPWLRQGPKTTGRARAECRNLFGAKGSRHRARVQFPALFGAKAGDAEEEAPPATSRAQRFIDTCVAEGMNPALAWATLDARIREHADDLVAQSPRQTLDPDEALRRAHALWQAVAA